MDYNSNAILTYLVLLFKPYSGPILSDMPQRYPFVADERLCQMGYCKLTVKNYIVFFSIDEKNKVVDVERILYDRRAWLRIL